MQKELQNISEACDEVLLTCTVAISCLAWIAETIKEDSLLFQHFFFESSWWKFISIPREYLKLKQTFPLSKHLCLIFKLIDLQITSRAIDFLSKFSQVPVRNFTPQVIARQWVPGYPLRPLITSIVQYDEGSELPRTLQPED